MKNTQTEPKQKQRNQKTNRPIENKEQIDSVISLSQ